MYAMFKGQPIFGPQGPQGPDGNPIGTIISYMGKTAPKDYLICDGAVYDISEYADLARFFAEQFGSSNYFGGNGTTTFAVPDMRNLFLRGYHGTSEEQLSGEVGVKQEATQHPYMMPYTVEGRAGIRYSSVFSNSIENSIGKAPEFSDAVNSPPQEACVVLGDYSTVSVPTYTTSRPVNMAVLYCIKATVAEPRQELYSEEETRIGTWIDGKPVYRKTTAAIVLGGNGQVLAENVDEVINAFGVATSGTAVFIIPEYAGSSDKVILRINSGIVSLESVGYDKYRFTITLEYTKTTDPTPTSQTTLLTSKVDLPQQVTLNSSSVASDSPLTVTFPSTTAAASASVSSAALRFPFTYASASSTSFTLRGVSYASNV